MLAYIPYMDPMGMYIYIYASSVATRCYPVGFQVLQLEGFKMLSGFYVAYAFIWYGMSNDEISIMIYQVI